MILQRVARATPFVLSHGSLQLLLEHIYVTVIFSTSLALFKLPLSQLGQLIR